MKYYWSFVIPCLLFSSLLTAQTGFREGYTVKGQIDNVNYYQNSIECRFKNKTADSVHTYLPDQLKAYRFTNGKYYISRQLEKGSIFLEFLVNGQLNVFFYQDKDGENHYLLSKDSVPIRELEYVNKVITVDGSMYAYESKRTIGLLEYYTADCPALKYEIEGFKKPDHRNLIELAEKYHRMVCTDHQCIIYEKKIPFSVKLNISPGSNIFFKNVYEDKKGRIYPSIGGSIVFNQPQRNENYYMGIGYVYEADMLESIPLSFIYSESGRKFSPYYSFSIDINHFGLFQEYQAGVKFEQKGFSVLCLAGLKTEYFVVPFAFSPRLCLLYDMKNFGID